VISNGKKNVGEFIMRKYGEDCVLEDRLCSECGECDRCELDEQKTCDNCCKCIEGSGADYAEIKIDDILLNIEGFEVCQDEDEGLN